MDESRYADMLRARGFEKFERPARKMTITVMSKNPTHPLPHDLGYFHLVVPTGTPRFATITGLVTFTIAIDELGGYWINKEEVVDLTDVGFVNAAKPSPAN